MNRLTINDLMPFCSTNYMRELLHHPFLVNSKTFATDGRICVMLYDALIDAKTLDKPPSVEEVMALPAGAESAQLRPCDIPEIPDRPDKTVCGNCSGEGVVSCCCCGHEDICNDCDGKGTSLPKEPPVVIGKKKFNPDYLREIIKLPGLKFFPLEEFPGDPAWFTFEGGEGRLMFCRKD